MSLAPLTPTRQDEAEIDRAITDFQSDTAEIENQPEPMLTRITLYAVTAMIVAAITWASLARIDRVVSATGRLVSTETPIVLQPFDTAILKSITVRAGDIVKAGQVLATMDPTFAQSDIGQISVRLQTAEAGISRLEAELSGETYKPPKDLPSEVALGQLTLWRNRQAQFQAQVASYDERIARANSTIASSKITITNLTAQRQQWKEIEGIRNQLLAAQVGSKLNALAATTNRLDVERNLAAAEATEQQSVHELDDLKAQREAFVTQWKNTISQDLIQQRSERDVLAEQMAKARKRQDLVTLTAPVDAVVLEVANRSVGSVATSAEPLFTLVPINAPLEAVVQIDGREIGFIRQGDPVAVKFDTYNFLEHGAAEGVVRTISDDSFSRNDRIGALAKADSSNATNPSTGLFYRAHIDLTAVNLRNVPEGFRLLPGLPLTADVKIGSRTIIAYFLKPLLGSINESMREP
ncbi:HlyD family type I secretion periplasmic adaptor subunit [Azospirillum picis]|uniref:Membrane fusion protein (MFP) family protein n=1 Tax=Azospirillum picis TaxID=488438 RepID=A0ABU0MTL5_9PROT|nr:HlyD family type I secretion periplasmic adaptor subunit [Azospirillum picis]MBP2303054.1 HlyD family type I secretion membrane fusion protein [Azospirillum picis]MDQ0536832.1 HlyD family type I secretion membrane fusion protein [Azospirillum picis]